MEIDWKEVSQSPGYISLKACYIDDVIKKSVVKSHHIKNFNGYLVEHRIMQYIEAYQLLLFYKNGNPNVNIGG